MKIISFRTLLKFLRALGLSENWEALLPELPESPYLYYDNGKKHSEYGRVKSRGLGD